MISKTYIKELGFNTLEDFFNYILDSEINGNYSQVTELMNKLSQQQFKEFINWFNVQEYTTKNLSWFIMRRRV
jgi:hypothetical protein